MDSIYHQLVNNLISEDIQLIIMRGIQGSGKSTFANNLKSIIDGFGISEAIITSADNYFINKDGSYVFNGKLLGKAHKQCQKRN